MVPACGCQTESVRAEYHAERQECVTLERTDLADVLGLQDPHLTAQHLTEGARDGEALPVRAEPGAHDQDSGQLGRREIASGGEAPDLERPVVVSGESLILLRFQLGE
jgi:hypothetical protein